MKPLQEAFVIKFKKLLKSKDPQKAAQIIKKEYFATGPDKKNLKKSARDFKKKYGYTLSRMTLDEEILQKRMKHVEACFDATLEVAKETAMKQMLLDKIAKKQLKSAKVTLNRGQSVQTFRCLHDLIHLENTPEAKLHNEQVVSLMLYNQGLIPEEKFKTLRRDQLKKANRTGEDLINAEAGDKKAALLDLIQTEVASLKKKAEDAEKGAKDILNFGVNNPEKLKKAFAAVEASRADLLRTGYTIYTFGNYDWKNNVTAEEKQWVAENLDKYGCRNDIKYKAIEGLTNPYMAIMGLQEIVECVDSGKVRKIEDDYSALGRYMMDAGDAISPYATLDRMQNEEKFNTKLEAMGMQGAKSTSYTQGFTIYKKGDDILITKDSPSSIVPFKMERRMAKPTEFVKTNFLADVSDLYEQYKECNTKKSSPAYDNMENELKKVRILSEGMADDTNITSLDMYKKVVEKLKISAQEYLTHKEDDFRKRNKPVPEDGYKNHYSELARSSYERKRIELAESILKFAESKMEAFDLVKQYKNTMAKQAEMSQDINPTMNQPEMINDEGEAANGKEDKKEENQEVRIKTNINEMIEAKDKEEGKEHKEKTQKNLGSNQIVKENPKLQMDPLAKKGF